ncbi:hypothetical protein Angca_000188 [Angiostrongylus cantonensis]|nr:hypothetical protein Angca_000188 [Angiostrongylus cantonensis]
MITIILSLAVAVTITAKMEENTVQLDMCRTLLDDEMCDRTMPILNGYYPATKMNDRLVVRFKPDPFPILLSSEFLPYNCHVLRDGEETTEDNAFVLAGCPWKMNVAIYQSKVPVRVQFIMQDVLGEFRSQMSGNYIVKCAVAECSRNESTTFNKCPDYDHCEKGAKWNPDVLHVNVHQIPAIIKMRFYPMYKSAHRH